MLKLGILVSGGGSNLQAIIDKKEEGYLPKCQIELVISSNEEAYALERAKKHGIQAYVLKPKDFNTKEEYDRALIRELEDKGIDLVVLAGFMIILGKEFIRSFEGRIINVHPALIPAFAGKGYYGLRVHQEVLEYGVKITGASVHFVDIGTDTGPIILQRAVEVRDDDSPETLQKRVMVEAEWQILPEAIKLISEGKVKIVARKVSIGRGEEDDT